MNKLSFLETLNSYILVLWTDYLFIYVTHKDNGCVLFVKIFGVDP